MGTCILAAPTALPWQYDDGGRAAAGYRGETGDCVVRAIAIATGLDYRLVYEEMATRAKAHQARPRSRRYVTRSGKPASTSPRDGVIRPVYEPYLLQVQGWAWTPTMGIGTGTTVHLAVGELPDGPIIAQVSGHLCAVIDGVVHDTYDPTREGTRCVYGYYTPGA